jgi:hypothetical protein
MNEKLTGFFQNFSIFISFPHFYKGDPKLRESFEGLKPEKDQHESYMDLNERLGFPLNGVQRFQFNLRMKKSDFSRIKTDLIVPILWMEVSLEKESLRTDLKTKFYYSTVLLDLADTTLKILSIILVIICLIALYFNIHYYIKHFQLKEFKNLYVVNAKN